MYRFYFNILLVLISINGFSVCHAAQHVRCERLTTLLGAEISYASTEEFSTERTFKLHVVQFLDGSYNIGFEKLDKKLSQESFVCSEKILNYVRSSSQLQCPIDAPIVYVGVVRCTQDRLYIKDIDIVARVAEEQHDHAPVFTGNFCSPSSIGLVLSFLVMEMIGTVASCPSLVFEEHKEF